VKGVTAGKTSGVLFWKKMHTPFLGKIARKGLASGVRNEQNGEHHDEKKNFIKGGEGG